MSTEQDRDVVGVRETTGDILHQARLDRQRSGQKAMTWTEANGIAQERAKGYHRRKEGK